jgi:hypothetical protein
VYGKAEWDADSLFQRLLVRPFIAIDEKAARRRPLTWKKPNYWFAPWAETEVASIGSETGVALAVACTGLLMK